jgi:dolichol-phosphate mannosyltransferase
MWFGQVPALWSVILFSALPIYIGTGVVAFPDGPLIFFWLLALCGTSQALTGGRNIGWLWAGLGFGGALLSKYTAVMFAPSLLLLLLVSPSYRHWLRRPQPWLALGLGLALFTPVIIWNSQNEWASFLFQSTRTNDARNISLRNVGIFWLYQLAILTPPVLALFARNIVKMWRVRDAASKFALAFGAPFFLLFVAASFKTQVHVNWTAPAFLALIPSAAALVVDRFARSRAWRMAGWVTGAMVTAFFVFGLTSLMWGQPRIFAASRVGGWRVLAVEVERVEQALEAHTGQRAFILGADRYNLAAELSFYTREPEEQVNAFVIGWQGLGFKYWTDLSALEGHPAVAVLTPKYYDAALSQLRVHFARVDEPRRYEAPSLGKRKRVVYLVNCYGYRTKPEPAPAASSSPAR